MPRANHAAIYLLLKGRGSYLSHTSTPIDVFDGGVYGQTTVDFGTIICGGRDPFLYEGDLENFSGIKKI